MAVTWVPSLEGNRICSGDELSKLEYDSVIERLRSELHVKGLTIRTFKPYTSYFSNFSKVTTHTEEISLIDDVIRSWTSTELAEDYTAPPTMAVGASNIVNLLTENDEIFVPGDVILVQGVRGYESDGRTLSDHELVLYVISYDDGNGLNVMATNGKQIGDVANCVPSIEEGTTLIRIGNTGEYSNAEYSQVPMPYNAKTNFCQTFKKTIKLDPNILKHPSSLWTLTDMIKCAKDDYAKIKDLGLLFGSGRKIWNPTKLENVYITEGLWYKAGKIFRYSGEESQEEMISEMIRQMFIYHDGPIKTATLYGGSKLISWIGQIYRDNILESKTIAVKWGHDYSEIRTEFGSIKLKYCEIFDDAGMENNGILITDGSVKKYVYSPEKEIKDLTTGTWSISESCCLMPDSPNKCMRIIKR